MWKLVSIPILLAGLFGIATLRADETLPTATTTLSAKAGSGPIGEAPMRDSLRETLPQEDEGSAFWRGESPQICTVSECPASHPTYCVVKKVLRVESILPNEDPCDQDPRFRDATRQLDG